MVIIDLIGWITFALLLVGAGWAAWRVYGDLQTRKPQPESDSSLTTERAAESQDTAA